MTVTSRIFRRRRGGTEDRHRYQKGGIERSERRAALFFLAPQLIGLVVFLGIPLVASFALTFTKWDLIAPAPTPIGLDNWARLASDTRVPHVLGNTLTFIAISTTGFLILSLLVAVVLASARRGSALLRALFFIPWVIAQIAVGAAWAFMFNSRSGPVGLAIEAVGLPYTNPMLEEETAMVAVAMVATWAALGYGVVIYIAGLQGIPRELYEAVRVDGANAWQRFRHITVPLLSPTILFLTITSIIFAFQLFDLVVLMTGSTGSTGSGMGGPNGSTRTIVMYLYQQMFFMSERLSGLGYAATIGWLLASVIFVVTLIQWRVSRRWVFYSGDG